MGPSIPFICSGLIIFDWVILMHIFYLETKNLEDKEKDSTMEEWDSEMRAAEKGNWIN